MKCDIKFNYIYVEDIGWECTDYIPEDFDDVIEYNTSHIPLECLRNDLGELFMATKNNTIRFFLGYYNNNLK